MSRLTLLALTLLLSSACVLARLQVDATDFDISGLEVLQGRYGSAYPGYEGYGQQPAAFGWSDNTNLGYGMMGTQDQFAGIGTNFALNTNGLGLFGGVGVGGNVGMGSKKGTTTMAAPIYAESMIVPKIITQPILRPHVVTQPIVQQQLIQQPIVETRQVIQPVVRRIITQPIIRPQILESTTIQPTLKQETIVQPHLIEQTVITPSVQNVAMENAPIQEAPTTQVQQAVVQPVQSKKGGQGAAAFGQF